MNAVDRDRLFAALHLDAVPTSRDVALEAEIATASDLLQVAELGPEYDSALDALVRLVNQRSEAQMVRTTIEEQEGKPNAL